MSQIHLCRDCGQPMETVEQPLLKGNMLTLITCKNRDCDLWSVTLSTQQYQAIGESQWDEYRTMVKKLKSFYKKGLPK